MRTSLGELFELLRLVLLTKFLFSIVLLLERVFSNEKGFGLGNELDESFLSLRLSALCDVEGVGVEWKIVFFCVLCVCWFCFSVDKM